MAAERHLAGRGTALAQMLPACEAAIALVVALAFCTSALALDPSLDISQYAHASWKISNGFTKGMIAAIAQGDDGYLWIGTEFGLTRFDGVRAVAWQPPAGQQLPSDTIESLELARDGTLWIGTLRGLASWKDGKLTTYPEMAGQMILSLMQDRESTIWAGGFRIPAGAKLCSIRNTGTECSGGDGSLGVGIYGLYEDTRRNLWVGTNKGFWRWKPGSPQFFPALPQGYGIRGISEDDEHAILLSVKGGISRFVNGRFESRPLPYRGLTTLTRQIFRDRDGSVWIATFSQGLVHVHQGKVDTFSLADGLSGDTVYSMAEDREGNVWAATNNGIDRFRAYTVPTISRKQGLGNTFMISTLAASDGSVWIARAGGLERWDKGKISTYGTSSAGKKQGRTEDPPAPSSLFQDSRGRIWGATDREFGHLDGGRIVPVRGYPNGFVRSIAEAPEGHLWAASDQAGLLEIFGGKVVQQLSWRGLGFEKFGDAIVADPAKKGLWIGFWQGGIAYFADKKIQASYTAADGLGQGTVNDLRIDFGGSIWVGTDGGLSRIQNRHISTLTRRNGLPCDVVLWSIEDDGGDVWLYMPCGLVHIAKQELDAWASGTKATIQTRVLDASDGVGTHTWVRVYRPPVTKTRDGKIWFTTSDGISVIDPHHLPVNTIPPPVHIENISADGKGYTTAGALQLPAHVRDLTIDYTALSLVAPEKIRFRYKLEGQDPDWREVVNDRHVQYSNLAPRHYVFHVKACNNSGVWNEEGASLDFAIPPAYYQTSWFRALLTAVFVAVLWSLYQLRIQQLRRQESKLRDVIGTMPTFVWSAVPDGSVDFVNRHWEQYTGLSAVKTVGAGWQDAVHPDDLKRHEERWRISLATGGTFESEVRYRRAEDGQYHWFLTRAVPLRDKRGKIVKWYGTSTDIEDRKRAELLRDELAHVNRITTMGELLASISHELKQPITASIINAGTALRWLRGEPPNVDEASNITNKIIESGKFAIEIIDRLRSLYKKGAPKWEPLAVNELIGGMIAMLRGEAAGHRVSIAADLAANVPIVNADRVQIQQVLMNLMLNGIEAMKDSGGVLTIKSEPTQDGRALISITDTGVGLPTDNVDQIFQPFVSTKKNGSGMGLAISRSIIESHGGRLWATRNSGTGATFHFTLRVGAEEKLPATGD